MKAHTKETQATMTPAKSLQFLKEGNLRFQNNLKANRNLLEQVNDTSEGQFPFATILSCIDSRVSAELIFDQGLGDIFSVRIAGNFVNQDILGSMEFACKLAGTKLVVVLGHTACGAVKGACDDAKLGNLTGMLSKIKPAVKAVSEPSIGLAFCINELKFMRYLSLTLSKLFGSCRCFISFSGLISCVVASFSSSSAHFWHGILTSILEP